MIDNPILRRELKVTLRSRLTLAMAAVYLIALAGIVCAMWPQESVFSRAAQASRSILLVFTVTQLVLVMLFAPAFAATAISAEKEQNSYELLFATLLRPHAIVLGKLTAAIACLVLFVALSLPLFATCFFLGAVSVPEAATIYLVLVASAVFFGMLGLCVSAVVSTSHVALVVTYLLILIVSAGPWIPFILFQNWTAAAEMINTARSLSPLGAMAAALDPSFNAGQGARLYLLFVAGAAAVMMVWLLSSAYISASRRARGHQRAIENPQELLKRRLQFPFYLIDPLRRRGTIPRWMNPIFARELRNKAFGGGVWIFRCAYLCFAVSLILIAMVAGNLGRQTPDVIRAVALVFQIGLVGLVVPSLTAGAITQERERANLDLLRSTRIGPLTFLLGKIGVACVFLSFLVIGSVPLWYGIHFMGTNSLGDILRCWAIIGSAMLVAMMAGLFSSSVAPRTPTATALAYGIAALLFVGTFFPLLARERLAGRVADVLFSFNPFISSIQVLTTDFFQELPELWKVHLTLALGLSAAFFLCAYARVRRMLSPTE